jgi:hypothetical protein
MSIFDKVRGILNARDIGRTGAEGEALRGTADNRGLFGYARRAHGADPNAKYGFENNPNEAPTLPPSALQRPE